jgi:hypothetical protein
MPQDYSLPSGMTYDPEGSTMARRAGSEKGWFAQMMPWNIAKQWGNAVGSNYEKSGMWARAAEGTVNNQINDLGSWYKKQSGTSFLDTESAKSAMEELRRTLAETLMGQQNNAVMGGATQESQLAGRKVATQNYGDAVNKLVGYNTQRQDSLSADYQNRLSTWLQAKMGQQTGRAQNYSTSAENLAQMPFDMLNAGTNMVSSLTGGQGGGGIASLAKFVV